jgi:hypothetical protein
MVYKVFIFALIMMVGSQRVSAQNFNYQMLDRPWAVEVGVGPGWTYADNSSAFRRASFALLPAASASLTKNISHLLSVRGTLGFQMMEGNFNADLSRKMRMGQEQNAYHFEGNAYYFDLMPVVNFIGGPNHVNRSQVNLFAGLGAGLLYSDASYDIMDGEVSRNVPNSMLLPIVPVRAGVRYRFRPLWDLGLEGSLLLTFTDDLDGHRGYNRFNDYPMNLMLKVRKLFSFEY